MSMGRTPPGRPSVRTAVIAAATVVITALVAVAQLAMASNALSPRANAAKPLQMFAMGNSYISGQGADNHQTIPADMTSYLPGTTGPANYCFRSRHAAVEVVARDLSVDLTNATCANSEPRHVDETVQFDEGLQIDRLPSTADIVVLQVIGNPEFIKVVECVQLRECDDATVARSVRVLDEEQRLHERRIVREVQRRAPDADVFVLGAPQVVPRVGQDQRARCGWFMSDREVAQLNRFIDTINAISRDNARRTGETYVDLARPGSPWNQRHDLCSADPWQWGPRVAAPQYGPDSIQLRHWLLGGHHPTMAGQRATAHVLEQYIRERGSVRIPR
ncbi:GDSL-type esterase/lipase family protein [Gordonia sp. ABSL11-1]|uniref:GDSL-type esterase/lipase family protein n=1 Tax=Gordonia sp. ABSL11-1 TaxID=3053924 RepID=UPI002573681F|nr:GDSL-type esterase/lipase family protein [Gordonia sp. ABSL11-1]MDL9948245.1 GDSL-type esterase/lipase family protein [Gordonia sp. ABSL11-1]